MQIDNFIRPSQYEWIRYENRNLLFARPCNSGKLLTRECNCNIVVTKLHGVLRAAISHTRRTIEGYAGTDRHSGGGTQITVHCHASNATCYVLLCYWRIIDVALASCAHPCNEPRRISLVILYTACVELVRILLVVRNSTFPHREGNQMFRTPLNLSNYVHLFVAIYVHLYEHFCPEVRESSKT